MAFVTYLTFMFSRRISQTSGVQTACFPGGVLATEGCTHRIPEAGLADMRFAAIRLVCRTRAMVGCAPQIVEADSAEMLSAPRRYSRRKSPRCGVRPADSRGDYRRHAGHIPQITEAAVAGMRARPADSRDGYRDMWDTPSRFSRRLSSTCGVRAADSWSTHLRFALDVRLKCMD
jgi:hypothetical protein